MLSPEAAKNYIEYGADSNAEACVLQFTKTALEPNSIILTPEERAMLVRHDSEIRERTRERYHQAMADIRSSLLYNVPGEPMGMPSEADRAERLHELEVSARTLQKSAASNGRSLSEECLSQFDFTYECGRMSPPLNPKELLPYVTVLETAFPGVFADDQNVDAESIVGVPYYLEVFKLASTLAQDTASYNDAINLGMWTVTSRAMVNRIDALSRAGTLRLKQGAMVEKAVADFISVSTGTPRNRARRLDQRHEELTVESTLATLNGLLASGEKVIEVTPNAPTAYTIGGRGVTSADFTECSAKVEALLFDEVAKKGVN